MAGGSAAWILVEREHGVPLLVGPYPDEPAAARALDSLLIDDFAEEDALDIRTLTEPPGFKVLEVIPDLADPHHTGPVYDTEARAQ